MVKDKIFPKKMTGNVILQNSFKEIFLTSGL